MSRKKAVTAIAALALAGGATVALSQQMQHQGPMMGMRQQMQQMMSPEAMKSRIEGRIAFLKAELKITEAQTAAWNELAGALRTMAASHEQHMKMMMQSDAKPKTLVERMELMEQHMATRAGDIKSIKAAAQKLFAQLTEEQKKEADQIVMPMMGMGMMMEGPMMQMPMMQMQGPNKGPKAQ
ncbi:MAG: Spy/CpxP family protein refolding chaperone [Hyphomicrobiaceae bacterium]|nr:MAG: Spy/CpxP family protein refolding chaperone [Hyphomicrobiaceae bacterium]